MPARIPLDDKAARPTAVVYEKRPRWSPELQRQFAGEPVRVIACRSLADVSERCAGVSRGVILVDFSASPSDCARFLADRLGDSSGLPVIVVVAEEGAELEWPLRDLGALAVCDRKVPGHEIAALCRKQWTTDP